MRSVFASPAMGLLAPRAVARWRAVQTVAQIRTYASSNGTTTSTAVAGHVFKSRCTANLVPQVYRFSPGPAITPRSFAAAHALRPAGLLRATCLRALCTSKPGGADQAGEAGKNAGIIRQVYDNEPTDNLPMTTPQKVKAGVSYAFWAGVVGVALACGIVVGRELMPTKFSSKTIFDTAFQKAEEHPEITMRIGSPVVGYGQDWNTRVEGRRNFVASDDFTDEEGRRVSRIKFNIKGPRGKGVVYAAVSDETSRGDLLYLIFEHPRTKEAIPLIDNRRKLTIEDEQMRVARAIKNLGGRMFGSEDDQWTQRQKMELGDYYSNVEYVQCDRQTLDAKLRDECTLLMGKFPAWKFEDRHYKGFKSRAELRKIVQRERRIAEKNK